MNDFWFLGRLKALDSKATPTSPLKGPDTRKKRETLNASLCMC